MRLRAASSIVVFTIACSACSSVPRPAALPGGMVVDFEGGSISATAARDARQRSIGLTGRTRLARNAGVLFLYPSVVGYGFQSTAMLIPVSVAFLKRTSDRSYRVVAIVDMRPCIEDLCPRYAPGVLYDAALQVTRGWFRRMGVRRGDEAKVRGGSLRAAPDAPSTDEPPTRAQGRLETVGVAFAGARVDAELADDGAEQEQGLMFRRRLGRDAGMLFVFSSTKGGAFWMKNTLVPLSIAFLHRQGGDRYRVAAILDMTPCRTRECPLYGPGVLYDAALEVNRGWFRRSGVRTGATALVATR